MPSSLRTSFAILAAILVALLLVGTFADEAISGMLHDQANPFGIFLAAFGELPASLGVVVGGTLLVLGRHRERRGVAVGQVAGGVVLVLLGTAMTAFMPSRYLETSPVLLAVVGFLLVAATVAATRWLSAGADRRTAVRVGLVVFLVVLLEMLLVNLTKVVWERPRLRFLAENPEVLFQPWYVIGSAVKDTHLAAGVSSEEFKSFPSGHTANGAALMLLVLLAPLKRSLVRHQQLLLWAGAVFGLLVGLSRIIVGAHFVSDAVVGFAITFVLVLGAHRLLQRPAATAAPTLEKATA